MWQSISYHGPVCSSHTGGRALEGTAGKEDRCIEEEGIPQAALLVVQLPKHALLCPDRCPGKSKLPVSGILL